MKIPAGFIPAVLLTRRPKLRSRDEFAMSLKKFLSKLTSLFEFLGGIGLSRGIKSLSSGVIILCVTWLLLEVALTFLDPILFKGPLQYDAEFGFRIRPYALGSNEFGFNDRDRPHAKPADTYRILILGDSFNWSGGRDCSYSAMLEKKFAGSTINGKKVEVINAGYIMTGPPEEFLVLKRYGVLYEPDLVVLGFFAGNDFNDSDPNRKRIVVNAIYFDIDRRQEVQLFGFPILRTSRVLAIITQYRKIKKYVQFVPNQQNCWFDLGPSFTEEAFLEMTRSKLSLMSNSNSTKLQFQPNTDYVAQTIHSMKEYLNDRKIGFKVALLPDELQIDRSLFKSALEFAHVQDSDVDLERPQHLIREILEREGVAYVDLLQDFRAAFSEHPEKPLYILRNTHWNRAGNELATEILYKWLSPVSRQ
jgi:hypothetical protein